MTSPIYTSKSNVKSIWQTYLIFNDHLVFDTLFGKIDIPFEHIESVKIAESDVKGLFKGELQLKGFQPALKLDWANFLEHIVLDKNDGKIRRILFTPDKPEVFEKELNRALENFKNKL